MSGLHGSVPAQHLPRIWTAKAAHGSSRPLSASWSGVKAALALIEVVLIAFAAMISVSLFSHGRPAGDIAAIAALMATPLTVLALWVWGQYQVEQLLSLRSTLGPVALATLLGAGLAVFSILIATSAGSRSAIWAGASWVIVGAVVLLHRAAVAFWLRRQLAKGGLARQVAVIAPRSWEHGAALARDLAGARGEPCRLSMLYTSRLGRANARDSDKADEIVWQVTELAPDEVLVVADSLFGRRSGAPRLGILSEPLLARLQRLPRPITVAWPRPDQEERFLFMDLVEAPLSDAQRLLKRACDLLGAFLLLVLFLPLFALLPLLIKLDSPGPAFFRQQRHGLGNDVFEILKFRSMHVAMSDPLALHLTSRNDPRVTRVGALLRRWSLDEVPQLLNVIQGTMSLVGPRPHPLGAKAGERLYEDVVTDFAMRYRVKPGITGWAQINGLRGNTDSEDKLIRRFEHDMEYIHRWSIWLDFKILVRTPLVSMLGKNAY